MKDTEHVVRFINSQGELETCLAIRRKVFIEEQRVPEDLEIDELDVFAPDRHVVLLADGHPVGTARLKTLDEGRVKYQRIAILPEYRGKGLGRVLLEGIDRLAAGLGYWHVRIEAQQYAEEFYHRCGFVTTDPTVFLDAAIPHVRMEKDLLYPSESITEAGYE